MSDVPTLGNSDTDPVASPQNGRSYWAALKHRKVMGVGITVPVVVRIAIEVAAAVPPQLGIPERTSRLVTLVLLIGFPIALIITMVIWSISDCPCLKTNQYPEFEELIWNFGCRLSDLTVLSEHFKEAVDP